jgi:phage terminase large subunit-like protein
LRSSLAKLSPEQRQQLLQSLPDDVADVFARDWRTLYARPSQIAPESAWTTWLILAGRGFGKTRTGAEWIRERVDSGVGRRIALVARTAADARDVMVEGESGLLAISPERNRPRYEPSKRRLTWPSGARATLYSADEPNLLRGPQHDTAWCDELAAWQYPDAWDQLQFGLRLGRDPRTIVTTTPRPTKLIRELTAATSTVVTRGSTFENAANLATQALTQLRAKYEGTRLGRQELFAEILDDTPGALWTRATLERAYIREAPELRRIVVALDPSVGDGASDEQDEAGIIAAGVGFDRRGYVLGDASLRGSPNEWARAAIDMCLDLRADAIVAEANQGGEMVRATIRTADPTVRVILVHASRGKLTRAEPIAALYEQSKVHHVGALPQLEDELCTWSGASHERSPNRLDALVHALTELLPDLTAPVESVASLARYRARMPRPRM